MRARAPIAAALAATLFLAACGDDDGGGGELSSELQPYADALVESFENEADETFESTAEQKQCFADEAVAIVGLDRLEAVGTPDEVIEATDTDESLSVFDLSDDEIEQVAESFVDCVPDLREQLEEQLLGQADLTEEQQDCVLELFTDDLIVDLVAAGISGGDVFEVLEPLQSDFEACE